MRALDWVVLFGWLAFLVSYGIYRGRGSTNVDKYLLAGRSMPWYAIGLSIMATQASAITFISTTGQSYTDGMRFVQFYFGLPFAMIAIAAFAVPAFRNANVYTAYEYLERRFDAKTRALVSALFLIQRGLGAGLSLYAPALVLSLVLGWSDRFTTILMGTLIIAYTTFGGIKAITWADVQQMTLILLALLTAFFLALHFMPANVSFRDAMALAGAAGRLNAVVPHFNWNDRYNLFSGLIGGFFLFLAYFGCDQSQVQRYLTGRSLAQSRISLLFNGVAKIPMQFFILFIGTMVFVLFTFDRPPMLFQPAALEKVKSDARYAAVEQQYEQAFERRKAAAAEYLASRNSEKLEGYRAAEKQFESAHVAGEKLVSQDFDDTNYIFLSFITRYMPMGLAGLIVGVIFSAAMSSTSGEINSLATVTVIDFYRRFARRDATDEHYLVASRTATVFWGIYAMVFAQFGGGFGALIQAVNVVGSLFYGGLLGVFVLAFFFKRVGAAGAFYGVLAGEAAIFAAYKFTGISFLWYNPIGCGVVVLCALLITLFTRGERSEVKVAV